MRCKTLGFLLGVIFCGGVACSAGPTTSHQKIEGAGGRCASPDAGAAQAASNDPGCPATWSDVSPGGNPATCTSSGLVCTYPEGQAECALDGSTLKWWTVGANPGCGESAPTIGAACGSPGLTCGYVTGPPDGTFTTNYCCDGTQCAWTLQGSHGCPNGNACGSISTSDYDQSCSADSDCVLEPEGDFCTAGCTNCVVGGVVSVAAQARYEADLASRISTPSICPCPLPPRAICNQGRCATTPIAPAP